MSARVSIHATPTRGFQQVVAAAMAALQNGDEDTQAVACHIESVATASNLVSGFIHSLIGQISNLKAQVDNANSMYVESIDRLNAKVNEASSLINERDLLSAMATALKSDLERRDGNIQRLSDRTNEYEKRMVEMTNALQDLKSQLDLEQSRVAALKEDYLKERITSGDLSGQKNVIEAALVDLFITALVDTDGRHFLQRKLGLDKYREVVTAIKEGWASSEDIPPQSHHLTDALSVPASTATEIIRAPTPEERNSISLGRKPKQKK